MSYLLDTCAISEFTKRQPEPKMVQWLASADELSLYLSVITVGEIRKGIARLPDSQRKQALAHWLEVDLVQRFSERLLPLDANTLFVWGNLTARLEQDGLVMPAVDALIAATALQHDLTLVTRNQSDFEHSGVENFNPWL
jgi:predicted nucleic acid-binding protein